MILRRRHRVTEYRNRSVSVRTANESNFYYNPTIRRTESRRSELQSAIESRTYTRDFEEKSHRRDSPRVFARDPNTAVGEQYRE